MDSSTVELIRGLSRPLQPRPTQTIPQLNRLPGIRAVIFDIYGTLLISAAGDITLQTGTSNDEVFREALISVGLTSTQVADFTAQLLQETIGEHHRRARDAGLRHPEVDIVAVWRDTLAGIGRRVPSLAPATERVDPDIIAVRYECGVNPVWPMPDAVACLAALGRRNIRLGIVSNAQAMTAQLFPALLGQTLGELGFAEDLQFFSYLFGESKPGLAMFRQAAKVLAGMDIPPSGVVYVGNDMLNDVWAASQVGFRTILFAGDERSLRLRADKEQVRDCAPDAIVTDLPSITECLGNP